MTAHHIIELHQVIAMFVNKKQMMKTTASPMKGEKILKQIQMDNSKDLQILEQARVHITDTMWSIIMLEDHRVTLNHFRMCV